ncbi:DUF1385 domain-containing protein [Oribacterium sp. oral taxon 102]|uniref:DUF1385 domain-containing protein n=1 Tax=Oribacterium sp. oral taxon 102 TaxID=671214 RepID=UPI0015BCA191|nr:DUF1385 domain-containing protein [Oribacterium sp. oral taxon 102]NWO20733.1 DUF1385 domain-containing protein [Oribacterium sp. oral taxon 102]
MAREKRRQRYSGIGGQAVIEGIMMKNGEDYAVAVRKPNGEIEVKKEKYRALPDRYPLLRMPFLRGIFSFADAMVLGMRCLSYSASFFEDDADSEPSRLERWLIGVFGERLEAVLSAVVIAFSFVAALLLFVLLPTLAVNFLSRWIVSESGRALLEGLLRVLIFVLYIRLISKAPDIRRTFEYHGAEHKCINCVEHGLPLTVENVMASSKEHKRCGTSFLVYVMMISILLFMLLRFDTLWLRLLSRLLLIPVIAGISYELLRVVGIYDNLLTELLFIPGMWMQGLTTTEPDAEEVAVAIAATEAVFDWREYLRKREQE